MAHSFTDYLKIYEFTLESLPMKTTKIAIVSQNQQFKKNHFDLEGLSIQLLSYFQAFASYSRRKYRENMNVFIYFFFFRVIYALLFCKKKLKRNKFSLVFMLTKNKFLFVYNSLARNYEKHNSHSITMPILCYNS